MSFHSGKRVLISKGVAIFSVSEAEIILDCIANNNNKEIKFTLLL